MNAAGARQSRHIFIPCMYSGMYHIEDIERYTRCTKSDNTDRFLMPNNIFLSTSNRFVVGGIISS